MLKQKALTKTLIATLCTTSNTLFVHNKKTVKKAAFVYTQNAQKVVRNLNAQQQAAFNNLPATYAQKAKKFVINKLAQSTLLKN
jgi:phosphotransferase system IIB component